MRNRFGIRAKVNGDENAVKKNSRQSSTNGTARTGHSTISAKATLAAPRTALGEVNLKAIIRNKDKEKGKTTSKDKEDIPVTEAVIKRSRSSSLAAATGPQRIPHGPTRVATSTTRSRAAQPYKPATQVLAPEPVPSPVPEADETTMEVEGPHHEEVDNSTVNGEREVEEIVAEESDDEEPVTEAVVANKPPRVWPEVPTDRRLKHQREIDAIRETFENNVDLLDPTMVSEYADEIFEYMEELEVRQSFTAFILISDLLV
jgi:G2/mitotic-specific cyclin 2